MELAKSYYSKAVTLNPNNMRSLYGLLLVRIQFATFVKNLHLEHLDHLDCLPIGFVSQMSGSEEERAPENGAVVFEANHQQVCHS